MPRIALLSTSDTDLLSARASGADYVLANPGRASHQEMAEVGTCDVVVARILGRPEDLCSGFRRIRDAGVPTVVVGGERTPSAELMEQSTVPTGVALEVHAYLAEGGPANLRQLHAFVSDTVLLTGEGFDPPQPLPDWGVLARPTLAEVPEPLGEDLGTSAPEAREFRGSLRSQLDQRVVPRVGILFYKAHFASGNDAFVHALADAVDATGEAVAVPIYCSSLRGAPDDLLAELGTLDALVVTVLAAGGTKPATSSAGGDDEAWDVEALAALDIPVLQGLCLTWDRATWVGASSGETPSSDPAQVARSQVRQSACSTGMSRAASASTSHASSSPPALLVAGLVPPAASTVTTSASRVPSSASRSSGAPRSEEQ